jgi:hypothetical protein
LEHTPLVVNKFFNIVRMTLRVSRLIAVGKQYRRFEFQALGRQRNQHA